MIGMLPFNASVVFQNCFLCLEDNVSHKVVS